jgi:hypothetical protein
MRGNFRLRQAVAAATENWFIRVLFPTKGRKTPRAARRTRRAHV